MGRHKKPTGEYGPVRIALASLTKAINEAEDASTEGKRREKLNGAITASESTWQELRYLARNL